MAETVIEPLYPTRQVPREPLRRIRRLALPLEMVFAARLGDVTVHPGHQAIGE